MTDSSRKTDRNVAANPWFIWKDLPLILLFLPVGLFFGWHLAWLAMLTRRWLRVPYVITMVLLYICLLSPLWFLNQTGLVWPPLAATIFTLFAMVGPIALHGRDEIMNGSNLEHAAPGHMILCLMYVALPAVNAIWKGNAG